jgi:predicted MPP superfamily phosphohydrolase
VKVLENDCVRLEGLCDVVGINDLTAERFDFAQKGDAVKALAKCGSGGTGKKIVLAHQPNHARHVVEAVGEANVLILSGHVHGGQIFPLTLLARLFNDYFHGLYKISETAQVFVGRGTGQWGPRLRLGARAEIVKIRVT